MENQPPADLAAGAPAHGGSPAAVAVKSPRYLEVARVLIDAINQGTYPLGSLLPPEMELCVRFGASRHTIREAIRILDSRGMVSRRQGIGTLVTAPFRHARYTATLSSLNDLLQHIDATELVIESDEEISTDASLAELLECPVGQRWLRINAVRVLKGSGEAVALTQLYIHLRFAGIRDMLAKKQNAVFTLIEEHYQTRIAECRQDVTPIVIGTGEAELLGVQAGTPGLHITRHYLDDQMANLAVSVNRYPKDRFRFLMRWRLA